MPRPTPPKYRTTNWSEYNAALKNRGSLELLGQRLAARTFERQTTEIKVRAAILNRFSQIGTPNTIRVP